MVMIGEKNIKEMTGMVVSNKGDKTITVSVDRVKTHPLYKKRYTVSKKYYAHDAENTANVGDKVRIRESRPMSKMKRWVLVDIIEKGVE
jgi:small subunit ribosomal protein S17